MTKPTFQHPHSSDISVNKSSWIVASVAYLALSWLLISSTVSAGEGEPVGVRFLPNGVIEIESHWNLRVRVDGSTAARQASDEVSSLVVASNAIQLGEASCEIEPSKNYFFDRLPNVSDAFLSREREPSLMSNEFRLRFDVDAEGAWDALNVEVDGCRFLVCRDIAKLDTLDECSAILYVGEPLPLAKLRSIVEQMESTPMLVAEDRIAPITKSIVRNHNRVAFSNKGNDCGEGIVVISTNDWKPSDELASLFAAKEAACSDSRKVFADLSVAQLNFKPSNGSHTPRWNAEHMMGRELLFFSQIYHSQTEAIPAMDLNPKQMPPDYSAAHPEWTGDEEARQMKRVEDFTRRFNYLLDGMPLDERAPGSRFWTPRALLKQMDRHYYEHTQNVRKKFDLEDWPAE